MAARDVAALALLLDRGLIQVGQVLARAMPLRRRPNAREVGDLCRLYLVSWAPGSAIAGFDLATPDRERAAPGDLAVDSLSAFLGGLSRIVVAEDADWAFPHGFDRRVLQTCIEFGGLFEHGIASIGFAAPDWPHISRVAYDPGVKERIRVLAKHAAALELKKLRKPLAVAKEVVAATPAGIESSFWKSTPLEQVAADQGVPPITDISELDAIWSEGDVFEDALSEVLRERAQRRRDVRSR